ncbi:MAG: LPS-assembly protein LptD, partial [Nitrospirota bacterium]
MSCLVFPAPLQAQPISSPVPSPSSGSSPPVEITADSLEFDQLREVYVAKGSVEVVQGPVRLTADQVTLHKLSGQLIATGHVYLRDDISDLWTEQLDININTEAGVITRGEIFLRERNSFVTGRKIQRFSESHYRIKEGSFTNCDAKEGEIPAWRFTFRDLDFDWNESLYGERVWFNINDFPVFPFPTFSYPLGGKRKSGFLIPTVGIDNVFGFRYRQEYFWAIDPSQDLTIAPLVLTNRGGGGELQYRYAWSRQARGEWLMNGIYDTEPDQRRFRAEFKGAHIHQVNRDLSLRMQLNYASDRFFLRDFSNSGVVRALPSQESSFILNH